VWFGFCATAKLRKSVEVLKWGGVEGMWIGNGAIEKSLIEIVRFSVQSFSWTISGYPQYLNQHFETAGGGVLHKELPEIFDKTS
jgi:hypothetical protein